MSKPNLNGLPLYTWPLRGEITLVQPEQAGEVSDGTRTFAELNAIVERVKKAIAEVDERQALANDDYASWEVKMILEGILG